MSHFAYYFPLGVCPPITVIPNGFFSQIDQNLFKAINGDDGGTWAPASIITIGGAGLSVTGGFVGAAAEFAGTVNIDHAASIGTTSADVLEVFATALFFAGVSFSAGLSSTSGAFSDGLTVSAGLTLVQALTAAGATSLEGASCTTLAASGAVTCTSSLAVSGATSLQAASVAGTLTVAGGASVTSIVTCSGAGRVARPAVIGAASGGGTASPQAGNEYYFPTVTADQIYTISDTGAIDGDWIEFWTNSATNSVTVNDPASVALQTIKNATGSYLWMKVKRILGSWKLVGLTKA